jgi:cytoskeletal protein RodZ
MPEIGETLRDARMRARIDVSEIEAKTKIRAKYLRALENEEWGLLPGPTFVKSFLRTYAQALGLDGKALVEEYRLSHEDPSEAALEPIVSRPERNPRARGPAGGRPAGGPSRAYMAIVGVVVLIIALLIYGLLSGGGGKSNSDGGQSATRTSSSKKTGTEQHAKHARGTPSSRARSSLVALSLRASAPVYVCLIGDNGRKAIPGTELQPGTSTSTYHARRFELTLGNGSVTMFVDGHARSVPASSQAIGYSITRSGGRKRLSASQQPTCR